MWLRFFSLTHMHVRSIDEQNSNDLTHGYCEFDKKKKREMSFQFVMHDNFILLESNLKMVKWLYEMKNVIVWSCQIQK